MLIGIVIALWLPVGFNVGFWRDGWTFFDKINTARLLGAVPPAPASRPSLNVGWFIAYALDSNSFTGVNLLFISLLVGRGLLCAGILNKLTRQPLLAFGFGVLALLVPADTAYFYLGAMTLNLAMLCWLAATYCILTFYETPRLTLALMVALLLLIGTAAYEIVFLFIPIGLLALWAMRRRLNRQFFTAAVVYIIVPAVMAVRYAVLWFSHVEGVNYQAGLLDQSLTLGDMLGSLGRIYVRHLAGGWLDGGETTYLIPAVVVGLVAAVVCWWLTREVEAGGGNKVGNGNVFTVTTPGELMIAGLLMIGLGVALYLPTSERDVTMRTYYFSSVGAALTLAAGGWWIAQRLHRRVIYATLIGGLALLGSWALLNQHADIRDASAAEQRILKQIIGLVPHPESNVALILLDSSAGQDLHRTYGSSLFLRSALLLIYDTNRLAAGLCFTDAEPGTDDSCLFGTENLETWLGNVGNVTVPYDRLILLRYDGETVSLVGSESDLPVAFQQPVPYDPTALIIDGAPPPRAAGMLADG